MNKKILLILIFGMFFISLASATTWGTYKQNQCVNLVTICPLESCNETIIQAITYPNSTIAVTDDSTTHTGTVWNYTFCSTDSLGIYTVYGYSTNTTQNESFIGDFEITYSGLNFKEGQATFYTVLFFVLIFFFIIILLAINQLPKSNEQDEKGRILSITYLKYLRPVGWMLEYMLIVAILYLASNLAFTYLNEQLFAKILFTLYQVTFMFAPLVVILWLVWIFVKMYHDKEMQKLLNRGFFPQSRRF